MDDPVDERSASDAGPDATPEDLLRYHSATALQHGLDFIERHGDVFAILRTHALLGARPIADCRAAIAEHVDAEGDVSPLGLAVQGGLGLSELVENPGSSDILGPLEALIALADLDSLGAPCVEEISARLGRLQRPDGSWGDASAPEASRLFATGMLAGHLSRTQIVRTDLLDRAGDFLARLWSPDLVAGRNWPALAAFGAWYSSTGDDLADAALQWIGRELDRGYRAGVHDAVHTVRILLHCDASAVPGSSLVPGVLLESLLGEQGADGGFAELAVGPDIVRVVPTFDAMLGIIRLCGVI